LESGDSRLAELKRVHREKVGAAQFVRSRFRPHTDW
jgi:hypothetical protein